MSLPELAPNAPMDVTPSTSIFDTFTNPFTMNASDMEKLKSLENVDPGIAAGKTVAVGAAAATSGMTGNELITLLTIIFIIAQIGLLVPKYWALAKELISRWRS